MKITTLPAPFENGNTGYACTTVLSGKSKAEFTAWARQTGLHKYFKLTSWDDSMFYESNYVDGIVVDKSTPAEVITLLFLKWA